MKASLVKVVSFEVAIDGVALGTFRLASEWEGMGKLTRDAPSQNVVVEMPSAVGAILNETLCGGQAMVVDVVKISPRLAAEIQAAVQLAAGRAACAAR